MKPTFYLTAPSKKNLCRIIIAINYNYKKINFETGERIEPGDWSKKKNWIKPAYISDPGLSERLKKLSDALEKSVNELIHSDQEVTRETILPIYISYLKGSQDGKVKKEVKVISFFEVIDDFINRSESGNRLKTNGKVISLFTIKGYKTTRAHLVGYEAWKKTKLNFNNLDKEFYNDFISYFSTRKITKDKKNKKTAKGHTLNSIGKHIKNLKVFINEARERDITVHPDVLKKSFRIMTEDTDQISLSVEELEKMFAFDYSENTRLDQVRDTFLLACYTGLRFADLTLLTKENIIKEGKFLEISTQKTGAKVIIPLHKTVLKILEKYNGIPPTPISNQKMNEYIKEVGKDIGLTEIVKAKKTRAGKEEINQTPKYKLITVHTARRSFATNLYLAEMDTLMIMKMTGHKTEKSFLKYIRVSEQDNATRASKHSFFN
jgi:integrase